MASSVQFPLHIKYTCRPDVTKTVLNVHMCTYTRFWLDTVERSCVPFTFGKNVLQPGQPWNLANHQNREAQHTPYTNSTTNDGKQFQFFNSLLYINYLCADHQLYLSNIKNEHIACFSIKDEPNSFGRGANNNFSNFNYYTFNICTPLIYSNNECNPTTMFLRTSVPTTLARENYFFFFFQKKKKIISLNRSSFWSIDIYYKWAV
jgi:hypothetical protein